MGKVKKGVNCSIVGCSKQAIRSINASDTKKANLEIQSSKTNRAYVCEEHYKIIKKVLKKEKQMEKWKRGF
ncbi:MAG: hypothetical protein ACTSQY_03425 [Candidatus Odinarchaeia archaeon]